MSDFEVKSSGLAGIIRSCINSDQFDLGGYTEARAHDLINASFSIPLTEAKKMIKITFIVGGGKLVRSKYNDDLSKWIIAKLREIGYVEDRSAAETFDSQGTFKQQHDTGQNLKYLIVFPHLTCGIKKDPDTINDEVSSINISAPEYIVCACESATFKDMVSSKVTSYQQKQKLVQILQKWSDEYKAIEQKLISGLPLTSIEQVKYDSNSGEDSEKLTWLQNEIKTMIDEGKLTIVEKRNLLELMDSMIITITHDINEATAESKHKKVEKLTMKRNSIIVRKQIVEKIQPVEHRLFLCDKIEKLYFKLFPLIALEDKGRSMSLTLADLKVLEEKTTIEQSIKALESSSRGWFLKDEDFEELCKTEEKIARVKFSSMKPATKVVKSSGSSSSNNSNNSWSTASNKKSSSSNTNVSKGNTGKKLSGFAAAFGDSD